MSGASLPTWLRGQRVRLGELHGVRSVVRLGGLHTVCDEARCPNRTECFSRGTATFLIMGNVCTRSCGYCSVGHGRPAPLDADEPRQVAATAWKMGLRHVVVTSVDRDDLADGGARHFAAVVRALRRLEPHPTVEVLTPDFRGDLAHVDEVLAAGPDVYNHNIETVRRLYPRVRRQGRYDWALGVIAHVASGAPNAVTKSGLMVGLGEEMREVEETLIDLHGAGCRVVTIGQYLRPTRRQAAVARYWQPSEFAAIERFARGIGLEVLAGPFVRSSYRAEETLARVPRS